MERKLLFDIETSPTLGYVWQMWEADVLKVVKPWQILCFSWKWFGEKKIHVASLYEYGEDEAKLVGILWQLFNQADVIIAHNGDKFDIKKSYAKFIEYGLTPPEPYKTIDTLKVARKYFKMDSNRLDAIGEYLGLGRKVHTGGFDLWDRCMNGDPKAYKLMEKYNKGDVLLLEKVYLKLRPFMNPNTSLPEGSVCHVCGGANLQRRGFSTTVRGRRQRVQCSQCGSWALLGKIIK